MPAAYIQAMNDTPALAGLIQEWGLEEVYHAGIEANGWPPWWQPSVNYLMRIQEVLERERT